MTLATLFGFMALAALLIISPGPNGVLIAKTVPTSGRAAGFANIAGFVVAFFIHGSLSILGLSALLVQSATLFEAVKLVGAAYLAWVGAKALRDAWRGRPTALVDVVPARRRRTLRRAFLEGLLTNALNPKVSMFYLAVFPQFLLPGKMSIPAAYELVVVHAMLNVLWFGAIVIVFAKLSALARSGRFERAVKAVTGAVFIGFGFELATYRP